MYRLLREYPNFMKKTCADLLRVGDIAEKRGDHYRVTNQDVIDLKVPAHVVENYPELWEKVVEKDYEILSFKDCAGFMYYPQGNFFKRDDGSFRLYTKEELLGANDKIHSIERLSDNKVFTVGDIVKTINSIFIITKLVRDDDWEGGLYVESKNKSKISIKRIEPYKQPLFTTEDGVDIYKGDVSFMVDADNYDIVWRYDETPNDIKFGGNALFFSTRLKAIQWIEENEPKYSERDIEETLNSFSFSKNFKNEFFNNLNNK